MAKGLRKGLAGVILLVGGGILAMDGCLSDAAPGNTGVARSPVWAGDASLLALAGDLHTHTFLTDGSNTQDEVLARAFANGGLDFMMNSEHGGFSLRDTAGRNLANTVYRFRRSDGALDSLAWATRVPRWVTLRTQSWPKLDHLRGRYPGKGLFQGFEWNVPSHDHASVGILDEADSAAALAKFEYVFDQGDTDTSRATLTGEGLVKRNRTHADALAGARFLQENFPGSSWFLPNHPSRRMGYSVADLRDFHNAAPDVCFGLEAFPGHQKYAHRGGYDGNGTRDPQALTYGGADLLLARVGGGMDALWGEGRRFFVFANSDYHNEPSDFHPGEFNRSITRSRSRLAMDILEGMKSGNTFPVLGGLIDGLVFGVDAQGRQVRMGGRLSVAKGTWGTVVIRMHVPAGRVLDHVDLVAGAATTTRLTSREQPGYDVAVNPTAAVVRTFARNQLVAGSDGWVVLEQPWRFDRATYFRLRGTNVAAGTPGESDSSGNPLSDDQAGLPNSEAKARADLWFYSNPVWVGLD